MYKRSDFTKPAYKTAEIMEILNISYSTIKNYDKQGKLPIQRTETEQDIIKSMMDKLYELQLEARNNNPIIKELMIAWLLK